MRSADGKTADRQCQTEPLIAGLPNNFMLNDEKFKKFMTAMLYSYKMINGALSDAKWELEESLYIPKNQRQLYTNNIWDYSLKWLFIYS